MTREQAILVIQREGSGMDEHPEWQELVDALTVALADMKTLSQISNRENACCPACGKRLDNWLLYTNLGDCGWCGTELDIEKLFKITAK